MTGEHATYARVSEVAATKYDRPLLSVAQAAGLMGVSKSVAYEMAAEGRLPGLVKLPGHRQLVRRALLEAWLRGEEINQTRPALRAVG